MRGCGSCGMDRDSSSKVCFALASWSNSQLTDAEHCDGQYETEDGLSESFYTCHLYLNDSAQVLGIAPGSELDSPDLLRGGATTFHSVKRDHRMDIDPKIGRVLIFQQRKLLHSGDEVLSGLKYTMRSDLMYRYELTGVPEEDDDGTINFGIVET